MQYKRFDSTYMLRIDRGEEIMECLTRLCAGEGIRLARVSAIGAVDSAALGVYYLEAQAYRREDLAARLRACTRDGYGPTLSIDCACTADSLGTLIQVTGNAGRVITMGFSVAPTAVTQFGITAKELDIRGSRLQNRKFQAAIDLVREGKLDLDHKISHTFHFLEAQRAFDFNDSGDPSIKKIVFTFDA